MNLALWIIAIVLAVGVVTDCQQLQRQFNLFLSTAGGGFEGDVDAFLGPLIR